MLLHGDLLPLNLLWGRETDELGVVDWESARIGDPAYDLAIVTRGHAKPFGCLPQPGAATVRTGLAAAPADS